MLEARGRSQLEGVVLGPPGAEDGDGRTVGCDLLVVSGGTSPATSLITQAGGRTAYDSGRGHFALSELPDGLLAAGEVAGSGALEAAELSGQVAGAEAAHSLGLGDADSRRREADDRDALTGLTAEPQATAVPPPVTSERKGKCFACLCEDVTAKDIKLSIEEGYDSIELSKRYTTTTMGPCQGRMCQLPAVRLMAEETGQSLEEIGTTTARPPWVSVPMGALAGRPFEPAKRSAIHARHRELGGNIMWAGDWRRAYDYGNPRAEALAVHDAAGLIDVSTLGKLIVSGPRRGRLPRPPLPEPLLEPEAGPDPLRRDGERRRPDHGRRHHLPARRGLLLRHYHVERRRRRLRLVLLVARRLAPSTSIGPT